MEDGENFKTTEERNKHVVDREAQEWWDKTDKKIRDILLPWLKDWSKRFDENFERSTKDGRGEKGN